MGAPRNRAADCEWRGRWGPAAAGRGEAGRGAGKPRFGVVVEGKFLSWEGERSAFFPLFFGCGFAVLFVRRCNFELERWTRTGDLGLAFRSVSVFGLVDGRKRGGVTGRLGLRAPDAGRGVGGEGRRRLRLRAEARAWITKES